MLRVCFLLLYVSSVVAWSYKEQDKWSEKHPTCGSVQRQSPIAFNTNEAFLKITLTIKYSNYADPHNARINNNGHGIDIRLLGSGVKPTISGGPLPEGDTYQFDNVHIHWGLTDDLGSEHMVNNRHFSAEIHAVHYNTKYPNATEAFGFPDGIAVVTTFYRTNSSKLFLGLQNISIATPPLSKSYFNLNNFKLADLFGGLGYLKRGFYTYVGSLTTPPCAEAVTWIIYTTPIDHNVPKPQSYLIALD
uniref:Carbonic anhydrase n=1 Tax=Musca domestica TaxID=7370 RepID=A0A1I8MUV2_MUSDO